MTPLNMIVVKVLMKREIAMRLMLIMMSMLIMMLMMMKTKMATPLMLMLMATWKMAVPMKRFPSPPFTVVQTLFAVAGHPVLRRAVVAV